VTRSTINVTSGRDCGDVYEEEATFRLHIYISTMDWVAIIGGIVIAYLLLQIYRAIKEARAPLPAPSKWMVGDITQHTLQFHNGMDYSKPTLISVQGILYDVTGSEEYGRRKWGGGGGAV
jgi:hypothetical protein